MLESSSLVQLTLARSRMFFRDPSAVFWTFVFPVLLSLALGIAFRARPPEPVTVAVADGPRAEWLRATLARDPQMRVVTLADGELDGALASGRVAIVVVPGVSRVYRFDPLRPESRLARLAVDDVLQRADGRVDPTAIVERPVRERGSRYIDFLLPGLIGMNIMSNGMWGIGHVLVELRTRKLIKRMVATPMRKSEFLLSFVLMRLLFLVLEIPVLLLFGYFAFSITVHGSIFAFVALAMLGALTFGGLGLLVASRARNTQTAAGLINLVSLPMFICSGVFFASSNFPESMQPFIRWLPLTVLNDSLRLVMNEGAGLPSLWRPIALLAGCAAVSFAFAVKIFRWR